MKDVFDAYPAIDKIYVVAGMPFIEPGPATNHAKVTGKEVETVLRPKDGDEAESEESKIEKAAAAELAKSEKAAAAELAKSEKAAAAELAKSEKAAAAELAKSEKAANKPPKK